MKPYHLLYEELMERIMNSSRKEVATRVVYDPRTKMKTTYYQDKIVSREPYATDIKWKDKDASTKD